MPSLGWGTAVPTGRGTQPFLDQNPVWPGALGHCRSGNPDELPFRPDQCVIDRKPRSVAVRLVWIVDQAFLPRKALSIRTTGFSRLLLSTLVNSRLCSRCPQAAVVLRDVQFVTLCSCVSVKAVRVCSCVCTRILPPHFTPGDPPSNMPCPVVFVG